MEEQRQLKVRLFSEGLSVEKSAEEALTAGGKRPMTLAEYATTSGVILRLENDVYVNAPVFEGFAQDADLSLVHDGEVFKLIDGGSEHPVEPTPVPDYVFQETEAGTPYRHFGIVHTDRIRVSPIAGCSYRCEFCDLPYTVEYQRQDIDGIIETVGAAKRDPTLPARHAMVSGGTPKRKDECHLDETVIRLARVAGLPVDVMMCPRPELDYLLAFEEAGVDGLFLNMELWGQRVSERFMPQKAHLMKPHFLSSIDRAVEVFGSPHVRSLVILGLEPLEDTLQGVRALAERGCVPVLSPFRPAPATPLGDRSPPDPETMMTAYHSTLDICKDAGLMPGPPCVPCQHNTLTFPEKSQFYVEDGAEVERSR